MKPPKSAIARLMAGPMIKQPAPSGRAIPIPSVKRHGRALAAQLAAIDATPGLTDKQRTNRRFYAINREDLRNKHRSPTRRVFEWTPIEQGLPDDELMVLVQTADDEVWPAFRDGDVWRNADASTMSDEVIAWGDFPDPMTRSDQVAARDEEVIAFRCELPAQMGV